MYLTLWAVSQAGVIDGVPTALLDGLGTVALVVVLFWMLATGRLATGRELREKNEEIQFLRAANESLTKQNGLMLRESVPATNAVMSALHQALENEER